MKKSIVLCSILVSSLLAEVDVSEESILQKLQNSSATSFNQKSFMPDISLILDASMVHRDIEDAQMGHLEVPGLVHGHGGGGHEGHDHASMHEKKGFNLNYAELAISSSVDPYFDLTAIFHIGESSFEIEEGYIKTRELPYNLSVKLGKFKSAFGYLNDKHHHAYSFADMPFIYSALVGGHALNEKGVQLQYVFPTDLYLMAGVELLRGENESSYGGSAFSPLNAEEDFKGIDAASQPNLLIGYIKSSFDAGDAGTLLGGVSIASGESRISHLEDEEGAHAFAGTTKIYGVDLTYKKYFSATKALSFQNEYLYRDMRGTRYIPNPTSDAWSKELATSKEQSGFYSSLVYQHTKNWRVGARYSAISKNDVTVAGIDTKKEDDLNVLTAMLEYNPSEFSRIRLQYNNNSSQFNEDGGREDLHEVILQFNYTIGAHGAHAF